MGKIHLASLALCAILLVSCGVSGSSTRQDSDQAEIDDRDRLLQALTPLTGIYQGTVTGSPDGSENFPIVLKVYIVDEPSGVNEAGKLRFRPGLRGSYSRQDFPLDSGNEKSLVGRYYEETGVLTMFSADDVKYISLTARISGNQILDGELKNQRGILGHFTLEKKR